MRNGVVSLFLACEPLAGWRHIAVTEHRRRGDWAVGGAASNHPLLARRALRAGRAGGAGPSRAFVRASLAGTGSMPLASMDQLNTHALASLYEAFPPEEAKRLAERIELHHTPKHGSWLNMAEIELSVLGRQCLARRIAQQDTLRRKVEQWEGQRNATTAKVVWQFTTKQARIKLQTLYPSVHG